MNLSAGTVSVVVCAAMFASAIPRQQFEQPSTEKLNSIPDLVLPAKYQDRTTYPLPASVDNVNNKYMPPIESWCIRGWSCANAAAISNCFNYEMNFAYDLPSSGDRPQYPYLFTYEFLNSGNVSTGGDGWMFIDAFDIVKETGCPTSTEYGGFDWGYQTCGWMSGYDKYYNAMKNKISEYYKIDGRAAGSVELIKQYLYDHADGSPTGGILVFQCSSEWTKTRVPSMSAHAGEPMLSAFGKSEGGHGVVIAGYDDEVGYDYNGDGRLTNDGSDIRNWEKGSWMVVNNWGDGWYWASYRLLALAPSQGGAGTNACNPVMFCSIQKNYSPELTFKISITHDQRDNLQLITGFAEGTNASAPSTTKTYAAAFNFAGGSLPMSGKNQSSTLEIGLDLTDLIKNYQGNGARLFLQVKSQGGSGSINSLSLMDYTGSSVKETTCEKSNESIQSGSTTTLSIPWLGTSTSIHDQSQLVRNPATGLNAVYEHTTREIHLYSSFAVSQSLIVTLRDICGRTVASQSILRNEGNVKIPALDVWGNRLSRGVYIVNLSTTDPRGGRINFNKEISIY